MDDYRAAIPNFSPVIPAKAGIQNGARRWDARRGKFTETKPNGSQRIPSPFMGLQG